MRERQERSSSNKKYTFFETPLDNITRLDHIIPNKDLRSASMLPYNPHSNHYFNSNKLFSSEPTIENGGMENNLLSQEDAKPDVYFRKKITPEWHHTPVTQIPPEQMNIINRYLNG